MLAAAPLGNLGNDHLCALHTFSKATSLTSANCLLTCEAMDWHLQGNYSEIADFRLTRAGVSNSADAGTCGIAQCRLAMLRHVRGSISSLGTLQVPQRMRVICKAVAGVPWTHSGPAGGVGLEVCMQRHSLERP